MRHPIFSPFPTTMPPPSSATKHRKPSTSATTNHHNNHPFFFCNRHQHHSFASTLDLLILILVLFSGTFLVTSYFSYVITSLSLLLPPLSLSISSSYLLGFLLSFSAAASAAVAWCSLRSRRRKCSNPKCKGLTKALEFDLQLQTEDSFKKSTSTSSSGGEVIDRLPWKGGTETNPDYECLRAELRKMAPPNGRAVLLFRAKCGCPVAKLVGWGPKKGRKHKKPLANVAVNGEHR